MTDTYKTGELGASQSCNRYQRSLAVLLQRDPVVPFPNRHQRFMNPPQTGTSRAAIQAHGALQLTTITGAQCCSEFCEIELGLFGHVHPPRSQMLGLGIHITVLYLWAIYLYDETM
ncbi:hypothetical protein BS47DRAFT_191175 [Hydnum rufescens UP504]|uniref:Uncharacterized protein n=1 Tax=Hydnum rufescens UP504 TaxID=1448309 RepID=A0A9P6ANX2_9AGAM|nr:hypothetical protein BS47DRAFT_191175 [Hydnum rufescens UP504]